MLGPELQITAVRKAYKPMLSQLERKAYHAAYRLLTEPSDPTTLATPGGRRSRQLDRMAKIIVEEIER